MDFQDHIRVCPITRCLKVGFPCMNFHRCLKCGFYSTLVKPENCFYLDFFISYIYPACKMRNFSAQSKVLFIPVEVVVDNTDSGDGDSLHNDYDGNVVSTSRSATCDVRRLADKLVIIN